MATSAWHGYGWCCGCGWAWQWLDAGWHKVNSADWMSTGVALQKFWERATVVPEQGRPAVAYDWYRGFLQMLLEGGHAVWFAKLVALGETAIDIALILGAFTGIAAFFGVFMNWHFVMAGSASTNALLLAAGIAVMMAWKTAGWIGLDRWILSRVGTPWQRVELPPEARAPAPAHT
ncbi:MAG: DoxX family protein [Dehalococcoidia bacterium]|nr:DoxX family protein [Dehalococcoidia bacterium]